MRKRLARSDKLEKLAPAFQTRVSVSPAPLGAAASQQHPSVPVSHSACDGLQLGVGTVLHNSLPGMERPPSTLNSALTVPGKQA